MFVLRNHTVSSVKLLAWPAAALVGATLASGAITHIQRLHNPAGNGGVGIEIEQIQNGFMYVAQHVCPYTLPTGVNVRPVLVRTDKNLAPVSAFTYIRPGETTGLYPTQLWLRPTDLFHTADGGYVVCGGFEEADEFGGGGGSPPSYGAFLLRVDGSTMQPLWYQQYQLANGANITFNSVVQTSLDGAEMYVVCGRTSTFAPNTAALVAGIDGVGNLLWAEEIVGGSGYGEAAEVIVYDQDSVALTGYLNGGIGCSYVVQRHGDVLVARYRNDGTNQFIGLYGQYAAPFAGDTTYVQETGATLARVNGSADLVIAGNTQAWPAVDCPAGPSYHDLLAFRIDPSGAVVWANRYGIPSAGVGVGAVQVKATGSTLAIAADATNTLLQIPANVGYFKLHDGNGTLAAPTDVFGSGLPETAAGIVPLGPSPFPAAILGTQNYGMPYLIRRETSIVKHCLDAEVQTLVESVQLPFNDVALNIPVINVSSQPLEVLHEPITGKLLCSGVKLSSSVVNPALIPPGPLTKPRLGPDSQRAGHDDEGCEPCEFLNTVPD